MTGTSLLSDTMYITHLWYLKIFIWALFDSEYFILSAVGCVAFKMKQLQYWKSDWSLVVFMLMF